ncbi:MAG: YbaK/EbsC family protein [Acidimicrobiia bacterium]
MGAKGTPATVAVSRAGVEHRICEYDHDPAAPAYGLEAAEKLGADPARVFKTLVAEVLGVRGAPEGESVRGVPEGESVRGVPEGESRLVVAVVPVAASLSLKALAAAAGGRKAAMAEPAAAERATGYVVGGISPLGHRRRLPVYLDESMKEHDAVLVSAGRRGLELELAPADLARLAGADFVPLTAP